MDQHDPHAPESTPTGVETPESGLETGPVPTAERLDSSTAGVATESTPTPAGVDATSAARFEETLKTTAALEQLPALVETLPLFREAYSRVNQILEQFSEQLEKLREREDELYTKLRNQGKPLTDEDGSAWFRTVMAALNHAQINQTGEKSLERDGSLWQQVVDCDGRGLRPGQPRQRLSGTKHSPEEMTTYLASRAKVGTVFDVPLYHSGLWLRLKTPSLAALTGLQYQLNQIKVTLGRESKGLAFSNASQTLTSAAVDFALQYVIDANTHYSTPSDLKEKIDIRDVPILLWGLAVTLYPKGFPYAHPCVANPETCQHITRETLNLNYLLWTDTVSLTQSQKRLMARRFEKISEDERKGYLNDHMRGAPRLVWFGDIGLTLKSPTVQEYEDAGRAWINGIIEMTQGAFNEPPHGSNRDQYISRLGLATTARQYAHWVASIHERDEDGQEEMVSDNPEVINETLNHVFSSDEYVEDFFTEINAFIDDGLISMVAIPSFNCPQCSAPASSTFHERFDHLVPLDVLSTFFTLVSRKHS